MIMGVLLKLIYFDIFYNERWLPQMMHNIGLDIDQVQNDIPVSIYFSQSGFDSKQFLKNAGSSSLFLFLYINGWLILILMQRVCSHVTQLLTIKDRLQRWLMWNQSINLLQSQLTPLMLSSMINLYDVRTHALLFLQMRFNGEEKLSLISIICSFVVMTVIAGSLVAIFIKIRSLSKNYDEETIREFKQKYSPLTADLRDTCSSSLVLYWKAINQVRCLITLTILLTLNSLPAVQMLLLLILSVIQQLMIIKSLPYESTLTNAIVLFNELAVSIYLYLALMLSDYMETQNTQPDTLMKNRLEIAWAITVLICFVIAINFLVFIIKSLIDLSRCLSRRRNGQRKNESKVVAVRPLPVEIDHAEGISASITHVDQS